MVYSRKFREYIVKVKGDEELTFEQMPYRFHISIRSLIVLATANWTTRPPQEKIKDAWTGKTDQLAVRFQEKITAWE